MQPSSRYNWYCCRATKKQGGSTKNKKDSQPKYLGTKMSDGQLAFPGQVLVTQRGTRFHPGHNVGKVGTRSACKCGFSGVLVMAFHVQDRVTLCCVFQQFHKQLGGKHVCVFRASHTHKVQADCNTGSNKGAGGASQSIMLDGHFWVMLHWHQHAR